MDIDFYQNNKEWNQLANIIPEAGGGGERGMIFFQCHSQNSINTAPRRKRAVTRNNLILHCKMHLYRHFDILYYNDYLWPICKSQVFPPDYKICTWRISPDGNTAAV